LANYKYYNRNPNHFVLKDCVCRAISTATGLKYDAINNLLELTAEDFDCDKLCICCYDYLLTGILCYRRINCNFDKTVSEVSESYPNDKLIIRVDKHLTSSIRGTVLDIWDCSNELVDCYWIIE
jgi:hypothetical protein